MSFDKVSRNALAKLVAECRQLLTADTRKQLQGVYGLQPDGTALPIANLQHLDEPGLEIARELRTWQDHLASTEHGTAQKRCIAAFDRLAQETAFTSLNRLAALRLCEERGHILECVRRGKESDGFALYEQLSGGALGSRGETYRQFLQRVFDELAQDLGVLFDRGGPQSLVFPGERCLEEVQALLNDPALRHLWQEDETIGWIYQYYNSQEERRRMREESESPRNSHELAVRNQFFTPRYVVEFLTDNTLGRIWYEMTKGATFLEDKCQYLVRRPNEIFLNAGQDSPFTTQQDQTPNKSQEDLLKEPVYIPYRPLKDPREIRLLDPACGSMHFGLYAFDLFEVMYEEAWDNHPDLLADLRKAITDKREFLTLVPKLIIEHNLHGIEIDPRCTQIAGLSLWLRAQKTWQRLGLRLAERPRIAKSNIVCAEPMPGQKEMLREFTSRLESPAIGQLVEMVFDKMQLAGEAGSLLKIEEEIRSVVTEAKALWKQGPKYEQAKLFGEIPGNTEQQEFKLDLSGITDEQFWEKAEGRIYLALREYAEQAQNGSGYQRRLFVEDAAQGFAFIDLCRKRYEVVLMNPPFGYPSERSKAYVDEKYPTSKYDLLASFIDRGCESVFADGYVGCITSRTVFFIEFFAAWRRGLFENKGLELFADLGLGVLDALVETAAFTVRNSQLASASTFVRLLSSLEKDAALAMAVKNRAGGKETQIVFSEPVSGFLHIDGCPMAYWVTKSFREHFARHSTVKEVVGEVRVGLQTGDDFRFIRTAWEVHKRNKDSLHIWVPLAKGGEFRKFYDDVYLLVNWAHDGAEIVFLVDDRGKQRSRPQNVACYFRPGLTYPMRTRSNFSPRVLPAGCIFNVQGNSVFETNNDGANLLAVLAVISSAAFESFTRLKSRVGDMTTAGGAGFAYIPGLIGSMPFPELEPKTRELLTELARRCVATEQSKDTTNEPSAIFVKPALTTTRDSLRDAFQVSLRQNEEADVIALESSLAIEENVQQAYGFSDADSLEVRGQFGEPVASFANTQPEDMSLLKRLYQTGVSVGEEHATKASQQRQLSSDRHLRIDEICNVARISPRLFVKLRQQGLWLRAEELVDEVSGFLSYGVGCAVGRWDIRFATSERATPELPDPFAPLPVCPPGMLQNADGLPANPDEVSANYPLRISWPGILVDDPNHPEDIERRVREVIEVIWKDQAEAIEREVCEILGVHSLREYFNKPNGFFADHLKRYSKSRRQAPIYWPLSTSSGTYTVWIYCHRLDDDFLYKVVNDYVTPKVYEAEKRIAQIETGLQRATGREATNLREAFEETKSFLAALQDFKAELLRVAEMPYKPNLNDGVLITAAPLWKLFRLPKWRKDLKECWEQLEAGDYDWAHLACSIWPERVQEKCKKDRSLAIAHGLEHLCETRPPTKSSGARKNRKAKAAAPAES